MVKFIDGYALIAYSQGMEFLETPWFTRWIVDAMEDDAYRKFQSHLMKNPLAGDLIRGGGGIRKIRLALPGRGKRGGARVIYYYAAQRTTVLFLYAYEKSKQGDLTPDQVKALRKIVKEEYP